MDNEIYLDGYVPGDYKCSKCGKIGVKLWRRSACSCIELFCIDCGHEDQSKDIVAMHKNDMLSGCRMHYGNQIWGLCPAVPHPDGDYWGYTKEGVDWWCSLPPKMERPRRSFCCSHCGKVTSNFDGDSGVISSEDEKKGDSILVKPSAFRKGDRVRYVPSHAYGDMRHQDCKNGVVSSVNKKWVFVKYDNMMCIMVTGDEPYTAQATDPNDLVRLG